MIDEFKWTFGWYKINNKYGEQLVYEPKKYAEAFSEDNYQPQITKLIETDKFDVFVDVGAAWGHFAIVAAHHCKRVIAFEPQPLRFGIMLYNCRNLFNIDCRYEFVSNKGEVPKMRGIEDMCEARSEHPYNVPVITLDDLDIKPDEKVLIKLDVEGSELKVLKGCPNLIANPNVDWIIDIHVIYGITDEMVFPLFKHKNIRDHQNDGITSVKEFYGSV